MRGTVDGLYTLPCFEGDFQGEFLQRLAGLDIGLEWIDVFDEPAFAAQFGGEAQGHLQVLAGAHDDLELKQVVAEVFEQARVQCALDGLGVDCPRFPRRDQLSLGLLAVERHAEGVDVSPAWYGENIGGLERIAGMVAKGLLDPRDRRLVFDGHRHVMPNHGQRRHGFVPGYYQPARPDRRTRQPQQHENHQKCAHEISPGRTISPERNAARDVTCAVENNAGENVAPKDAQPHLLFQTALAERKKAWSCCCDSRPQARRVYYRLRRFRRVFSSRHGRSSGLSQSVATIGTVYQKPTTAASHGLAGLNRAFCRPASRGMAQPPGWMAAAIL